jgi:hypothetical protein
VLCGERLGVGRGVGRDLCCAWPLLHALTCRLCHSFTLRAAVTTTTTGRTWRAFWYVGSRNSTQDVGHGPGVLYVVMVMCFCQGTKMCCSLCVRLPSPFWRPTQATWGRTLGLTQMFWWVLGVSCACGCRPHRACRFPLTPSVAVVPWRCSCSCAPSLVVGLSRFWSAVGLADDWRCGL